MDILTRYLPEEVPDTVFTRNELYQMGMVPLDPKDVAAFVVYINQNKEYKLFDIEKTRTPKKQKQDGFKLTVTNRTKEDILEKRREFAKTGTKGIGERKR